MAGVIPPGVGPSDLRAFNTCSIFGLKARVLGGLRGLGAGNTCGRQEVNLGKAVRSQSGSPG